MAKRIISNKVYESLQAPSKKLSNSTGKVLYANRFSGIGQVSMPEGLKNLIDSDFGLIGNNLLIQLEQKFKGYHKGPWYVDSRDGVIYIHNRKFKEEPEYSYNYQLENGEVLRVSFNTQTVTKRSKIQLTSDIDPEDKGLVMGSTGIDEPEREKEQDDYLVLKSFVNKVDKTMVSNYASHNWEDHRNYPTTPPALEIEAERKFGTPAQKFKAAVKEYGSKAPIEAYRAGQQEMINNLSIESVKEAINKTANALPTDVKRRLSEALKNCKNGKQLEQTLREILDGVKHLFTGEYKMEYLAEEWVDPREYDPKGMSVTRVVDLRTFSSSPYEKNMIENQAQRGIQALEKDPCVIVFPKTYKLTYHNEGITTPTMTRKVKTLVKIKRMKKVPTLVPLYKLYYNLFSRYGGSDKFAWAMNANSNGGLKTSERKLTCQMTVVGRPSLQSSQVIYLGNVGKKWSGYWYIKSVQHTMDAGQGYLCTLDLIKNNAKEGYSTTKLQLNTQEIVSNEASINGKTAFGKDKDNNGSSSSVIHNFTKEEVIYMIEATMKDGKVIDPMGMQKLLKNKFIYDEIYSKDPKALADGTVRSGGLVMSSRGTALYGKPELIWVDTDKVPVEILRKYEKFDYLNWTKKLLELYTKNQMK